MGCGQQAPAFEDFCISEFFLNQQTAEQWQVPVSSKGQEAGQEDNPLHELGTF